MSRIVNIMPMAGLGKRFKISKFNLPKPLIPIKNKPMFIQAAKSMPKSNLNIFICNEKIEKKFKIKNILKKEYKKKYKLITIKKNTRGQASTCLLAKKYLHKNDKVFIHSCDSSIVFNFKLLNNNLKKFDGVILTTKPNKIHLQNISSYGWVNLRNNKINKICCKKKASSKPNKDFVIIGSFAFKNKKTFLDIINNIIKKKLTVRNEFYLDVAFKNAIENSYKIKNLITKIYYSWGTPAELLDWEKKFKNKN